ncbi:hypothetical protein C5167_016688 [Papaver somniferum]|nr:hypothetical protein C5167_016688 [Papaver somniferum]
MPSLFPVPKIFRSKREAPYQNLGEVSESFERKGLKCNLTVAIDSTTGHTDHVTEVQEVIAILGEVLTSENVFKFVKAYLFGDATSDDRFVFGIYSDDRACDG